MISAHLQLLYRRWVLI